MKSIYLLAAVIAFTFSCGAGEAPKLADQWAHRHYPGQVASTECMTRDSDDDGYVSCTVFLKKGEALGIECTRNSWGGCGNRGCRIATGKSR